MSDSNSGQPLPIPPLSHRTNYPNAPLSPNEKLILQTITNRYNSQEITDSFLQTGHLHLLNLHSFVTVHNAKLLELKALEQALKEISSKAASTARWVSFLSDRSTLIRNETLRTLREHGLDSYIQDRPYLVGGENPISPIRDTNFCPYCLCVGHFPIECSRFACSNCLQTAPNHTSSSCPHPPPRPDSPMYDGQAPTIPHLSNGYSYSPTTTSGSPQTATANTSFITSADPEVPAPPQTTPIQDAQTGRPSGRRAPLLRRRRNRQARPYDRSEANALPVPPAFGTHSSISSNEGPHSESSSPIDSD